MGFTILGYKISKRAAIDNPNSTLEQIFAGLTGSNYAGIAVNDKNALTLSAVYACVKILSETIAELPIDKFKYLKDGSKERVYDPINRLVGVAPNSYTTSYTFRQTLMACTALYGNGYARIEFDKRMQPTALHLINPQKVEIKQVTETGEILYVIDGKEPLESWRVLHIKNLSFDGIVGVSPLVYHAESIANGLALQEYNNRFFGQGSLQSVVITRPGGITPEGLQALRDEWVNTYQGRENQHKTMVLTNGMDVKSISIPPEQAQFIASRNYNVEDIARVYRIPQHMLQKLDRATNNNIEHQGLEFQQYTMLPWIKNWEQELDKKLLKATDEYFKFNLNALSRGDLAG
jgi:HK97 family phage portal protein